MGASFVTMKAKGGQDDVREQFQRAQDQDRYENGHQYSGGFGMAAGLTFIWCNTFHTYEAADTWLAENTDKWDHAKAVRVGDPEELEWLIGAWCAS